MFRGQAVAEATSFADAPWWEVFQDPILKALIQEALRNNYDVGIAAARVQEARASLMRARSDLLPLTRLRRHRGTGQDPAQRPRRRRAVPRPGRMTSFSAS